MSMLDGMIKFNEFLGGGIDLGGGGNEKEEMGEGGGTKGLDGDGGV